MTIEEFLNLNPHIGTLNRNGKTVYYVTAPTYREASHPLDLYNDTSKLEKTGANTMHALEAIRAYHKAAHSLQSLRLQAAVSERYAAYVAQPLAHMESLTETAEQIAREYAPQLINTGA